MCEALAENFVSSVGLENAEIKKLCKGSELEGAKGFHPFMNRKSPIVCARYVTTDSGTGIVHIAPGHGLEDYQVGLDNKLDIYSPLDDNGCYVDDGQIPAELVGLSVLENDAGRSAANGKVLEILDRCGALLKIAKISHQYPALLAFRRLPSSSAQWTSGLSRSTRTVCASAPSTKSRTYRGCPNAAKTEYAAAGRVAPRLCISRQRSWGVPIPAFYDENGGAYLDAGVIRGIADKVEKLGTNFWYNANEAEILDGIKLPEGWDASKLRKGADTLDVWIDSGSSHAAVLARNPDLAWPADLYFEGSDQHRGWFQSSLWTADCNARESAV